jgi:hypothetical protein
MIECPHCHTVVLPTTAGACPSCMKDTRKPPDIQTSKIPIRKGCSMPEVCYGCGDYCTRSVKVAFSEPTHGNGEEDEDSLMFISLLFGFASLLFVVFVSVLRGIIGLFFQSAADRASTVSFRIRQCRSCARKGAANPHHVWFKEGEMDFVVHPTFADEFALANPEFDLETRRWQSP